MITPLIILAIMFTVIPVEAANTSSTKSTTYKQTKEMKLVPTKKSVRKTVHKKDCVVMIDKKTRKTYTVCPNS